MSDETARVELIDGLQEARLIGEFDLDVYWFADGTEICGAIEPD